MKKNALILIIMVVCAVSMFADGRKDLPSGSVLKVKLLIDDGLFRNKEVIKEGSKTLSFDQKYELYQDNRKSVTGPFLLNLLVGYGIGSYVQGDTLPGVISTGVDVVGGAIFAAGFFASLNASPGATNRGHETALLIGGVSLLCSRIFSCVSTFSFVNRYNNTLKDSLGFSDVSFYILPTIDDENDKLAIACRIQY